MPLDHTQQERERKHFDTLADNIGEAWWGHLTPAGQKRLQRRSLIIRDNTKQFNNPDMLEIGCGAGALSKVILENQGPCKLVCCDISPNSIELAKKRCSQHQHASFETADVTRMPYADATFDVIVGNSILHHVPTEKTLQECYRLLRDNGVIVFFEPNMLNPIIAAEKNIKFIGKWMQDTEDETAFIRWQVKKMLRKVGFSKVKVKPFDFLHPSTRAGLIPLMQGAGSIIEKLPLLKEISGSLIICACKNNQRKV